MRVLAIRGRNLASLEGEFSIDFTEEPLASAGIFAISGPTGAGKSTLLDAMCLALFSRTPRTELAKENNVRLRDVQEEVLPQSDPRFLLRRGTASGCRYRARWSVSRAREKESGRLQAARLTLYNIDAGKEEPGTNKDLQARIIELIGLTFDQFTRSVLLAQNDFSTFLKAEQGEKASLLEKLTGTEQYSEISRRIFAKNTEAKEAYEQLYARVQGIELLSEEEVRPRSRSPRRKNSGRRTPVSWNGRWHRWKPQGRSMSKERCDWRGRMRNQRVCDWNCNRPGNWTCNWNRP